MTIYDARSGPRWMRPTLRLRLTLLNGVLLVGGALVAGLRSPGCWSAHALGSPPTRCSRAPRSCWPTGPPRTPAPGSRRCAATSAVDLLVDGLLARCSR